MFLVDFYFAQNLEIAILCDSPSYPHLEGKKFFPIRRALGRRWRETSHSRHNLQPLAPRDGGSVGVFPLIFG